MKEHLKLPGLPPTDFSCLSDNVGDLMTITAKNLFEGIRIRSEAIFRSRLVIADMRIGNWSNDSFYPIKFKQESETTVCRMNFAGGFRIPKK